MSGDPARQIVLAAALLAVAAACGCGGDDKPSSSSTPQPPTTAKERPAPGKQEKPKTSRSTRERLVPHPRRARVERTVTLFVESVERSDSVRVCRLLGRPPGTVEGCALASGVDLHAVPSSDELSIGRIRLAGRRASVRLASGQTVSLRRVGRSWLVDGLRP